MRFRVDRVHATNTSDLLDTPARDAPLAALLGLNGRLLDQSTQISVGVPITA